MKTTVVINKCTLLYNSIIYRQYKMVCSHVDQILYFLLSATKERSSTERRMEGGIADETSMRPLKCECLGSAAYG